VARLRALVTVAACRTDPVSATVTSARNRATVVMPVLHT
jgi:hypothetical protein